jgi:hypothetical protein
MFWILAPVLALGYEPHPAQSLLDANPGLGVCLEGEKTVALFGRPFATDDDPQSSTDEFVAQFLQGQNIASAMGVEFQDLVFKDKIVIRNGEIAVYTYVQHIEGLPVHGSSLKIPVLLGATEKISHVGMRLAERPSAPLAADDPTVDPIVIVAQAYPQITIFSQPEKVIYEQSHGNLHRAWRLMGAGDTESYRFFVDTNTSEIVGVENLVLDVDVSGTVSGYHRTCCPEGSPGYPDCCSSETPPVVSPLEGVVVSALSQHDQECPRDPVGIVDQQYTAADGEYGPLSVDPNGGVATRLLGQWVNVIDCDTVPFPCDVLVRQCTTSRVNVLIDEPAGITKCQQAGETVILVLNDPPMPLGTDQVTLFKVVTQTHDWFRAYPKNG